MFYIDVPQLSDLTQTDVDELRHFADREISAGRYVEGSRLRTLLDAYVAGRNGVDPAQLLEENESMARELHGELATTFNTVEALDTKVVEVIDALAELLVIAAKKQHTVEAAQHFAGALAEIHKELAGVSKQLKAHVESADEIATPVADPEPAKPGKKK